MTASVVRTQDFITALGIDTHIAYTDGGYANVGNIEADLAYLGVSNIRDGISTGVNGSAQLSSYIALAQHGAKFTFIVGAGGAFTTASLQAQLADFDQVAEAVPGSVVAVEGPNEINNAPLTYNGVGGEQGAINLQRDLYAMVHADANLAGAKVDYFTGYATVGNAAGPNPATTPGLADFDNQHPYPGFGQQPAFWTNPGFTLGNETAPYGAFVYTETGYSTNGGTSGAVNADVQARQTLNLLMDAAKDGASKTFLYQLMDAYAPGSPQGDDGFGLFDTANHPKPAATAIHNLVAILGDAGSGAASFAPTASAATVSGLSGTGNSLTMQKSDGTQDIVVWDEKPLWNNATGTELTPAVSSATVALGGSYATVNVYDPMAGTAPIATYNNVSSVPLTLGASPLVVEVKPTPTPTPAPMPLAIGTLPVTFNWNPSTQLTHFIAAETAVQAGTAGARAKIVAVGDSTTSGVGSASTNYRPTGSYPAQLAADLGANADNFSGDKQSEDGRVVLLGSAVYSGAQSGGGQVIQTEATGDGFTFTIPVTAYDHVAVNYIDQGGGTATVSVDGTTVGSFTTGNTGNMATATFSLPAGSHSAVAVTANNATNIFIEGADFYGAAAPKLEVYNLGVGGADSGLVGNGATTGYGEFPGAVELAPNLGLIDFGINDILNGTQTLSQTVANITKMVNDFRSVNADPVIVIPEPINTTTFTNEIGPLRAALQSLATQMNVPIIDLSASYGDSWANFAAAGFANDGVHPNAAGYADIAAKMANAIKGVIGAPVAPSVPTPPPVAPVVPVPPVQPVQASDTLDLHISEDAWKGDAQYTIAIDGSQIGGVRTATASHAAGATQDVSLTGTWGAGQHTVAVSFLNDAWGGTASTDRNLYVDAVAYDGKQASGAPAVLLSNGTANFITPGGSTKNTALTLHLAEDAWKGDAQYAVAIDGTTVVANAAVTASNALGQSQSVNLQAMLSAGTHDVAISFLNDAWGGTATTDRNLYVKGIDVNANPVAGAVATLLSTGTDHFTIVVT